MTRRIAIVCALAAGIALTACSKSHQVAVQQGAKAAGDDLKAAASSIKNDPQIKAAGDAIKDSAQNDAQAVKDAAASAGDSAKTAAAKTADATQAAADKTKAAVSDAKAKATN